jgi:hypothetical protein
MDGRLCSIIRTPHTCVWRSMVVSRQIYRILWVKCTTSVEWNPIRIAESSVMDGWNGRYLAQCRFCFHKCFQEKENMPDGVLGEYCRGTVLVWSTCSVLPMEWRWSCVIDLIMKEGGHVWLTTDSLLKNKWVPPFLEILLKRFSKCFLQ